MSIFRAGSGLVLGFLLLCSAVWAEPLSSFDREVLWAEARAQLLAHRRLVYHDGQKLPDYEAFLVTNEFAFPSMKIPATPGDLQVGFATTINFNLLGARRNQAFVVADQSEEAVVAMMSLYRPLFLASRSPKSWLATLAGLSTRPRESLDSVFHRIGEGEDRDPAVLDDLAKRLERLVKAGKITDFDRRFTLAVIRDQIDPPRMPMNPFGFLFGGMPLQSPDARVPVFRSSRSETKLAQSLYYSFSPEGRLRVQRHERGHSDQETRARLMDGGLKAELAEEKALIEPSSFLNPENYAHIQKVLAAGGDHYAQGQIEDPRLWKGIARSATQQGRKVTDVYLSNIPELMEEDLPQLRGNLRRWVAALPGDSATVYEAALPPPHVFNTKEWPIGKPPKSIGPSDSCRRKFGSLGQDAS